MLSSLMTAGMLFTYLSPGLAKAGPGLLADRNRRENSQLRAVLRNHRVLTLAKHVKAVFWCRHAHSGGGAREARRDAD